MTLRLVVFDVDGTLIDSQHHIHAAMEDAFAGFGLPVPERKAVLDIVGLSLPVAVAQLAPHLSERDHDQIVTGYKSAFARLRAENLSYAYPGAAEALARLAQDPTILLGIATGKSRRGLAHILHSFDWKHFFVTVQVADDHPSKPHPSMLEACMRETGVDASRTVMIGDTIYDMDMARNAGVQQIGVAWGYHAPDRLGPRIVSEFGDLDRQLDTLWGQEGT